MSHCSLPLAALHLCLQFTFTEVFCRDSLPSSHFIYWLTLLGEFSNDNLTKEYDIIVIDEMDLCVKAPKEATLLHPPLPVFAPARILFRLLSLSLLRPVYIKDSQQEETVAGKVPVVHRSVFARQCHLQLQLKWHHWFQEEQEILKLHFRDTQNIKKISLGFTLYPYFG